LWLNHSTYFRKAVGFVEVLGIAFKPDIAGIQQLWDVVNNQPIA